MLNSVVRAVAFALSAAAIVACSSSTNTGVGDGGTLEGGTSAEGGAASTCAGQNPPTGTGTLLLCGQCTQSKCCTQVQACAADSNCTTLQTCLSRCQASDQGCITSCDNLYPNGITELNNLRNCGSQMCAYECSEPPTGCNHIAAGSSGGCSTTQFPLAWDCAAGAPSPQCVTAPSGVPNEFCCLQ